MYFDDNATCIIRNQETCIHGNKLKLELLKAEDASIVEEKQEV